MTQSISVVSPIGGCGNHVRWLILLDQQFSLFVDPINRRSDYEKMRGAAWPSYDNYLIDNYTGIDSNIVNEIASGNFSPRLNFTTLAHKLNEFNHSIYPESRTWHNWLITEWRWRNELNEIIEHNHLYSNLKDKNKKTLLLTIDPSLAYKLYVKFNSNCNNTSMDQFHSDILSSNNEHLAVTNENVLLLEADILFNEVLDRAWYQQLITWFNLEDNYASASIVHKLWYDAHKRAERELVAVLTKLYSD